jgi:predicted ArsR family transcriptional regulator
MADELAPQVEGIAALADPVRRSLYAYVVGRPESVSRDEAAAGVGVPRHTAKFHLDRLVEDGLLVTDFRRPPGRGGPGAGRPAKHYRRAPREIRVSLPERRYDLAGDLLATAIDEATDARTPVAEAVAGVAARRGAELGQEVRRGLGSRPSRARRLEATCDLLAGYGFEPREGDDGVELANCPFHALATRHTDLVCGMNHALVGAAVDALGDPALHADLVPHEGRCCVVIRHP